MAKPIFINLSGKYATLLGVNCDISDNVYQLIHHPEKWEAFLKFITTPYIWGPRAQKEKTISPFRKNVLNDLAGFGIDLSGLYCSNRVLFLRYVFNGRKVEKPNVHVELGRFNKFYSIIYIEYFKGTTDNPSSYIKAFYLHHYLEHGCYECSSKGSENFDAINVDALRTKLTYEPEIDEVEESVRKNWSNIWSDYLKLRE